MPARRAVFRPMARTMVMLGADLIGDEVTAVLELVKNAYDADAEEVTVAISVNKDRIVVRDTGKGMTRQDIFGKWLAPGTPDKAAHAGSSKPITTLGRVTLGEKGIGRLAVHHLGSKLRVTTRTERSFFESTLNIDWTSYEDPTKYLDEVENEFSRKFVSPDTPKGTELLITGLKSAWPKQTVTRLRQALALLMYGHSDFTIRLTLEGKRIAIEDSISEILETADYNVHGEVTVDGLFTATLNGEPVEINLLHQGGPTYDEITTQPCGPFAVTVHLLERANQQSPLYGVLSGTEMDPPAYQGFLVYRDGFRVLPYGNPGVDWLGLDNRRIRKTGRYIGNSQFLGFVKISHDGNTGLVDKTNREGMKDTPQFRTMQKLLVAIVQWLEERRMQAAANKRKRRDPGAALKRIDRLVKLQGLPTEVAGNLNALRQEYTDEMKVHNQQIRTMSDLAAVGLAAERMTHEIGFLLRSIRNALAQLDADSKPATDLARYVTQLEREIRFLEPLYQAGRRKSEQVSVSECLDNVLFLFDRDLRKNEIGCEIDGALSDFMFKGNKGLLIQVLVNLLDNAVYWLQKVPPNERRLQVVVRPDTFTVLVADSGPGIPAQNRTLVFDSFFSTRGGRGLGLYIARRAMQEAGCTLEVATDKADLVLPGAVFKLTFAAAEA